MKRNYNLQFLSILRYALCLTPQYQTSEVLRDFYLDLKEQEVLSVLKKGQGIHTGSQAAHAHFFSGEANYSLCVKSGIVRVSFFGGSEEIFHIEGLDYLLMILFSPKAGASNNPIQNRPPGGNTFRFTLCKAPSS